MKQLFHGYDHLRNFMAMFLGVGGLILLSLLVGEVHTCISFGKPALPLTSSVTSGSSLNFSGPQFPHLYSEEVGFDHVCETLQV